ncbi:alkaline phosphatase family protein [Pseudarthrobacter sp. P1]|uniref:alkaline phosphatase family protein n=1 Tax=Pseudarthrobacter sp. P1 TaxID=3418418 RepID=UPI003CF09F17
MFVINLENTGFDESWGPESDAHYLATELRNKGALLANYYAVAHKSLPNYLAQISGQGPNPQTQDDCKKFTPMSGDASPQQATGPGQMAGEGCVYPSSVPTIASQLSAAGKSWKGYMEDMGQACRHPALGTKDPWRGAKDGDQYATRHNPFVYFSAITGSPDCASRVVDLSALKTDLASAATTPNLSYITPNLCNDGHDRPCVDGRPGGMATADTWLQEWVPKIMASAAFGQDGMLVITFDEADGDSPGQDPSFSPALEAGMGRPNGGLVGALVLSPFIKGGTTSQVLYSHYSLLASIEDIFGLPYLGYASAAGVNRFGSDVY